MHSKDATGDEFPVLSNAEVPRLYPHHVIKHELQVEAALHTNLSKCKANKQINLFHPADEQGS